LPDDVKLRVMFIYYDFNYIHVCIFMHTKRSYKIKQIDTCVLRDTGRKNHPNRGLKTTS